MTSQEQQQEDLYRLFICAFMEWYGSEAIINLFDMQGTLANRVLPLFPRDIVPDNSEALSALLWLENRVIHTALDEEFWSKFEIIQKALKGEGV